ncbi:hypothetical protein ACGK9R_13710 [Halomonas sp. HNIBRBA4712]|uniref:hypothetical protein n=1 Tax=Halomonas sp. HNIBRBA4712 TaxID=3373087 RepID=UPI003745B38C
MATNQAFSAGEARATQAVPMALALSLMALTLALSPAANAAQDHRVEQYVHSIQTPMSAANVSVISQVGNDNRVSVSQSYSAQYQRGNFSSIRQIGNGNEASITQIGGNNVSQVAQNGNGHIVSIVQDFGHQGAEAFVNQSGQQSNIAISQSGSGYRSISVEQQSFSGSALPVTVDTY